MAELCPMCKKHEAIILKERQQELYKGEIVEYENISYFCSTLGEDDDCAYFETPKVMNDNLRRIREAYEATRR